MHKHSCNSTTEDQKVIAIISVQYSYSILCVSDNDVVHIHQYCNLLQYCTYIMYCVNIIHTMWYPFYHNIHHMVHSLSIANKVTHQNSPLYNLIISLQPHPLLLLCTHTHTRTRTHTRTHTHTHTHTNTHTQSILHTTSN